MDPQPRRTFSSAARAEVTPENVRVVVLTQVKEISLYGCNLAFASQLEKGMPVLVKIFAGSDFFEATATVVYSQPNRETCLVFRGVKPYFAGVLKKWLFQAMKDGRTAEENS